MNSLVDIKIYMKALNFLLLVDAYLFVFFVLHASQVAYQQIYLTPTIQLVYELHFFLYGALFYLMKTLSYLLYTKHLVYLSKQQSFFLHLKLFDRQLKIINKILPLVLTVLLYLSQRRHRIELS